MPVKKPDGSIRLCVDYRKVIAVTRADPHYMPTLEEVVQTAGSSSKLDLTKRYYQVQVCKKTGRRQHLLVRMGNLKLLKPNLVCNAPAEFQC